MSTEIRLATDDDRATVETIVTAAYSHYIERIGRKPGPMIDDYATLIRDKRVRVIIHDGAIKGVLVLIPEADSMLLDNIAVSPAAQGLGLGRKLLEFAEDAARRAGYSKIRLYTHEKMTENIDLYRRIGYVETHRIEEKGFKRVYMDKDLR
ncbi:MAG TPA: GNAT family N-acetyltransferase [Rhizobiaceae bacterium]|nr:GNAT family N-acetyltransferase [Rhizobiaceae bacterium]